MTDPASLVQLAVIGAPHGVKGEVRVKPFTANPDGLDAYGALRSADGRRFKIKRMFAAKNVMVVKFEGVNSRREAAALTGTALFIERHRLPEPEEDEIYITDLVGLEARAPSGEVVGTVKAVDNFGAGDLLDISLAAGGSIYVEFSHANVPDIDVENDFLTLLLPDEVDSGETRED
jgi:16S rRNA processing protein RimM